MKRLCVLVLVIYFPNMFVCRIPHVYIYIYMRLETCVGVCTETRRELSKCIRTVRKILCRSANLSFRPSCLLSTQKAVKLETNKMDACEIAYVLLYMYR